AVSETAMMANAWGMAGVEAFLAEADAQPMRIFFTAPPEVPPFPALESSAGMNLEEFEALLQRPECLGVGESYWVAVIDGDRRVHDRLAAALALGKRLEGHAAGARGPKLMAYAASGITSCHEAITGDDALERLRLGMAVQVREGFVRQEMPEVVPALKDLADTRLVMLCTDEAPMDLLQDQGAMNVLVRRAVEMGVAPARAVAWCSLNPARYFGLTRLGAVAPGYLADLVLLSDLEKFQVEAVWVQGRLVAQGGRLTIPMPDFQYPAETYSTMAQPPPSGQDFRLSASGSTSEVRVCQLDGDTIVREGRARLPVKQGAVQADPAQDVLKLAHFSRHPGQRTGAVGFVRGLGLKQGALATTLMWDKSSLIVWGASDAEMSLAAARVAELGGGIVVAAGERILAEHPLPICGVTSDQPLDVIVEEMEALRQALRGLGCGLPRPLLTAQTLCFTGLPFLRLTDKGLVDVRRRRFVEVLL
ncbi:MAG: adenine deaminase C-terminal domain-containing protein, partial [Desulfarculaceae bacterium]